VSYTTKHLGNTTTEEKKPHDKPDPIHHGASSGTAQTVRERHPTSNLMVMSVTKMPRPKPAIAIPALRK